MIFYFVCISVIWFLWVLNRSIDLPLAVLRDGNDDHWLKKHVVLVIRIVVRGVTHLLKNTVQRHRGRSIVRKQAATRVRLRAQGTHPLRYNRLCLLRCARETLVGRFHRSVVRNVKIHFLHKLFHSSHCYK